jgi:disulfide oxidoreductase YuzD
MSEKIKVEIYGIKDQSSGGCSCSGGCGPTKTMGELYKDFLSFLSKTRLKDRIDIRFIDILMDDMDKYQTVLNAMEKGYGLPLTTINDEIKFYGGINNKMIYDGIRKLA